MLTAEITDISNDLYAFYALQKGLVSAPSLSFGTYDLEDLNERALSGEGADLMKVSCAVLPEVLDDYIPLPVGGAFVKRLSPKLVWGKEGKAEALDSCELLVPGFKTTAFLLTKIFFPEIKKFCEMPYNKILESLASGDKRPALLIHSTEELEEKYELREFASLSSLWFENTKAEFLPLGCLVAKRSLGYKVLCDLTRSLRNSLEFSKTNEKEVFDWILEKHPHLSLEALRSSVRAWVNEETFSLSEKGESSLKVLIEKASPLSLSQNEPLVFKEEKSHVS